MLKSCHICGVKAEYYGRSNYYCRIHSRKLGNERIRIEGNNIPLLRGKFSLTTHSNDMLDHITLREHLTNHKVELNSGLLFEQVSFNYQQNRYSLQSIINCGNITYDEYLEQGLPNAFYERQQLVLNRGLVINTPVCFYAWSMGPKEEIKLDFTERQILFLHLYLFCIKNNEQFQLINDKLVQGRDVALVNEHQIAKPELDIYSLLFDQNNELSPELLLFCYFNRPIKPLWNQLLFFPNVKRILDSLSIATAK